MQGGCGFVDGRKRAAVGLVSFPGSGDMWLRQLLETATGICTGTGAVCAYVCVCVCVFLLVHVHVAHVYFPYSIIQL
jgi:hypothetical protein